MKEKYIKEIIIFGFIKTLNLPENYKTIYFFSVKKISVTVRGIN